MFEVKTKILIFFFLSVAATTFAQSRYGLKDTLAVVGNKIITLDEFQIFYKEKLRKIGLTDNGDTRIKYLQNLVDDELLLLDAKKMGIDKTKSALVELERIKNQELLNAFSKSFIEPTVNVTEQDVKQMYIKMNTKIKVKHLYASTLEEAKKLYDQLKKGNSFEELAKEVFHDEQLKENGGDLGYISVDEMDPNLEETAFSMKVGEISKPIKTVTGYSIVKVEDIKQNPFVIESEYLKARDRIKAFVKKRTYEEAAKRYTADQKKEMAITFDKSMMDKLFESLQSYSNKNSFERSSVFFKQNKNKNIVKFKLENWNLTQLVSELELTDEMQRKWTHSETDLEDFISGLMIRKNTIRIALKAQLDKSQTFKNNVEYNFNTFLIQQVERQLKERITISQDSVKTYYEENRNRFTTEAEIRLSSILLDNQSLADSVSQLLNKGISFEVIVTQFSIQTNTAKNKGDMGFFRKNDLGNLGDKVFGMNPGQWMGPISDDGKYLFLKCTAKKPPIQKNLSEVSGEIKETLTTLDWYKSKTSYVSSLQKEIHVQLFPEKLNTLNLLTKAYDR
ncbi:MAG: peptidylprolyl isomerase [Ignavibacteriaceae bacterium]|jgi:parvulin-like peptidyl-prolyl isomerase